MIDSLTISHHCVCSGWYRRVSLKVCFVQLECLIGGRFYHKASFCCLAVIFTCCGAHNDRLQSVSLAESKPRTQAEISASAASFFKKGTYYLLLRLYIHYNVIISDVQIRFLPKPTPALERKDSRLLWQLFFLYLFLWHLFSGSSCSLWFMEFRDENTALPVGVATTPCHKLIL